MISFWAVVLFLIGDSTCSTSEMTAKEGSCVTIPLTLSGRRNSGYIVWLKDAEWNADTRDYEGTIVYTLKPDKPVASEFENRVSVDSTAALTKHKLTISDLRQEDSGKYMVRYYDKVDPPYKVVESSSEISLEVHGNLCQVSVTGPKMVRMGMEVILQCSTVGPCPGSPEWRSSASGLASRELSKTRGPKTTQLSFKADWSHDGVELSCWPSLSNDACASRNITLAVEYALKGVRIKASGTLDGILEGGAVSLTCEVQRSNPSVQSYSWYRDDTVLSETGPVLHIEAVQPEDRGSYRCLASNSEGSGYSPEVTITVQYGPRGTKIKASCCEGGVKAGQRLTLTCEANANPEPYRYTWFRANTEPGGEGIFLPHYNRQSDLTFWSISASDAGEYMCQAGNSINAQKSSAIRVDVLYAPKGVRIIPSRTLDGIVEGAAVNLTCVIQRSNPSVQSYSWYKDRALLGETGPVLHFVALRPEDRGSYYCKASNSEGSGYSLEVTITVHYAPRDVRAMANPSGEVTEKTNLNLSCEARSNLGEIAYAWFKLTSGGADEIGQGPFLTLRNLSEANTGRYFCRTRNKIGEGNSSVINITVKYGPRKAVVIHNMTSRGQPVKESAVVLMCSSQSYPPIRSYKWHVQKNDGNPETLIGQIEQNLTIGSDMEGVYSCSVENGISNSTSDPIEIRFYRASAQTLGISTLILVMASVCSFIAIFLIIIVVVLVCRKRRKSTRRRLENGSRIDTSQGLVMHGMGDPQRSRETVSAVMAPPPGPPTNQHGHDSEPSASVNTVYSALKIPGKAKQGKLPGMSDGKESGEEFGINYASLQFQGKRNKIDPKPEESAECVYSKVSKPNRKQKEEEAEYENVKEAAMRWTERETEANEEDADVCYTAISFAARTGPPGPLGACRRGDSGRLEEDDCKSQNSKVKA